MTHKGKPTNWADMQPWQFMRDYGRAAPGRSYGQAELELFDTPLPFTDEDEDQDDELLPGGEL